MDYVRIFFVSGRAVTLKTDAALNPDIDELGFMPISPRCIGMSMTEYKIKRLGHHGDGIAEGPIYVPMTLPGETVSGTVDGTRLMNVRITHPSTQRVAAPCRHFKSCGGCQIQHASDTFVADWKIEVVRESLRAQGLDAEFRDIQTSPEKSRRRATLSLRRTKKGAMVGFHARASDVLVAIPDCQLLHPKLISAIPAIEALGVVGASRKAELSVVATLSDAGLDFAVSGGKPMDTPLFQALAQVMEQYGIARLCWDGEIVGIRNPPTQRFGNANVVPPPGAFMQATLEGEETLLAAVKEITKSANRILDLFSGCGTFTLPLAQNAEIHAVESDAEMLKAMDLGWRNASGLKTVTHEVRDLFRRPLMKDELKKFDAAVVDPPRAGAEAQIAELAASKIKQIAYVSCNPVTFARDAARLVEAGYRLNWIRVVDQFRWSSHVELVADFTLISA